MGTRYDHPLHTMMPRVLTEFADVNEALKDLSPDALDLLHLLSMFDGATIYQKLPIYIFEFKRRIFDRYLDALEQLVKLTLVSVSDWKVGPRTLQVHHSVQDTVRNGLNLDEFQKVFNFGCTRVGLLLAKGEPR